MGQMLEFVRQECSGPEGGIPVLIAHNGKNFDYKFLDQECKNWNFQLPKDWQWMDSLLLARDCAKGPSGEKISCTLVSSKGKEKLTPFCFNLNSQYYSGLPSRSGEPASVHLTMLCSAMQVELCGDLCCSAAQPWVACNCRGLSVCGNHEVSSINIGEVSVAAAAVAAT